jgi:hypothetical protein
LPTADDILALPYNRIEQVSKLLESVDISSESYVYIFPYWLSRAGGNGPFPWMKSVALVSEKA